MARPMSPSKKDDLDPVEGLTRIKRSLRAFAHGKSKCRPTRADLRQIDDQLTSIRRCIRYSRTPRVTSGSLVAKATAAIGLINLLIKLIEEAWKLFSTTRLSNSAWQLQTPRSLHPARYAFSREGLALYRAI